MVTILLYQSYSDYLSRMWENLKTAMPSAKATISQSVFSGFRDPKAIAAATMLLGMLAFPDRSSAAEVAQSAPQAGVTVSPSSDLASLRALADPNSKYKNLTTASVDAAVKLLAQGDKEFLTTFSNVLTTRTIRDPVEFKNFRTYIERVGVSGVTFPAEVTNVVRGLLGAPTMLVGGDEIALSLSLMLPPEDPAVLAVCDRVISGKSNPVDCLIAAAIAGRKNNEIADSILRDAKNGIGETFSSTVGKTVKSRVKGVISGAGAALGLTPANDIVDSYDQVAKVPADIGRRVDLFADFASAAQDWHNGYPGLSVKFLSVNSVHAQRPTTYGQLARAMARLTAGGVSPKAIAQAGPTAGTAIAGK